MTTLRIWAPRATVVEAVVRSGRSAMQAVAGGWHEIDLPDLEHGEDYAFALDGGEPLPDPRSRWQPQGVHGPSRVWDPARARWTDGGWHGFDLASAVLYELHPGTFTPEGTLDSAIERLSHLADLGITALELMPVVEGSGTRGWGYDGVDLFAVHHAYGGPDALARFVDACHGHGLGVVLDVVYNHLGPAGNYLDRFGPYFTDLYRTPWGRAVNYDDHGSDEVRRFVVDNAVMWCRDFHIDGLRLDAVHAIFSMTAVHVLEEIGQAVHALGRETGRAVHVIAESDLNDPRLVTEGSRGGYGLDAQWSDDFHHALHAALTGERDGYYSDFGSLADVATALREAYVYSGRYSEYRGRRHGRPIGDLPAQRFIGYLQNHDQVGNRAYGERSSGLLSPGLQKVGATLVLTAPFVPMLFQGEEWGAASAFLYFTAHEDPDLAEAVRNGRRAEFAGFGSFAADVPDPQDESTFLRSKLDWSELAASRCAELLRWHHELISLRRTTPDLNDPDLAHVHVSYDEDARWIVVRRGRTIVVANLSPVPVTIPFADVDDAPSTLLASRDDVVIDVSSIGLPPESAAILQGL